MAHEGNSAIMQLVEGGRGLASLVSAPRPVGRTPNASPAAAAARDNRAAALDAALTAHFSPAAAAARASPAAAAAHADPAAAAAHAGPAAAAAHAVPAAAAAHAGPAAAAAPPRWPPRGLHAALRGVDGGQLKLFEELHLDPLEALHDGGIRLRASARQVVRTKLGG